jgi:hypothetical protein
MFQEMDIHNMLYFIGWLFPKLFSNAAPTPKVVWVEWVVWYVEVPGSILFSDFGYIDIFKFLLSLSRKMLWYSLKMGDDRFLPHPFKFTIY